MNVRAHPLVSVVIPTYNTRPLLMETLNSVFSQTFSDYEVVVVDDGCTDDTVAHLAPLAEAGRIRIIQQANGGVGAARNRGINEAHGQYVALLDHDDLWLARKLETQVQFALAHPECSMVLVPWAMSSEPARCMFSREIVRNDGIVERPLYQESLGNALICSSAMFFEKDRAEGLRYGQQRECIEDQEFHIGLAARGKVGVAGEEILMLYRRHGANTSLNAGFWYHGIKRLRGLDREGRFAEFTGIDRGDLLALLAQIGRTAIGQQLAAGRRGRAMNLYFKEFAFQLSERRWKVLAGTPVLACLPSSVCRRALAR